MRFETQGGDHIAWRKHIQKLDEKIYAISNAYRCTGSKCGKQYRSDKAEILSLPYSDAIHEIPEVL